MIYYNGIKGKNYFEGWFFRICADNFNCALIPSLSVSGGKKRAFIQINCNSFSKKIEYDFADFHVNDNEVIIGENRFSSAGIKFTCEELSLEVEFGAFTKIEKDIMGCFKFGTPCKHKIISMKHTVTGNAVFNNEQIMLLNAVGYLEKDWGRSFPKAYCWLQCNDFSDPAASFFCSVAKIGLPVRGLICVLLLGKKEIRFATYNLARTKVFKRREIALKRSKYRLDISFKESDVHSLLAPSRGEMIKAINEDLSGEIKLKLYEKNKLIYACDGKNAGIEWVV